MSRPLFECLDELRERLTRASHVFLGLDYDGTLTPLVPEPDEAVLPLPIRRMLTALSSNDALTLTILSGRERADLQRHVDVAGIIYAGNHGLEISGPGWIFVEPTAASHAETLHELHKILDEKLRVIPDCAVEDKGLSLAIHCQKVAPENHEDLQQLIHGVLASSSHPYQLGVGRSAYEIRPRVYWNKASAIKWIKDRVGHTDALTIFVGDGVGNEDAFAELGEAITVKVGGDPAATLAAFHAKNSAEVIRFLKWLGDVA